MRETRVKEGLHLSDHLILPRDMVTHVAGILAMRGMGKSYAASVLMEEMVIQGLFVGFVDPLGIAWGIRSSADGEREGLPVIIFGGRRGDVPLDPAAGKIVAQAVLDLRHPYILDLSLFDTEDQQRGFLADFIGAFRHHENVLMHLIVDEADLFAPQIPQSAEARRSLAAMQALVRRFRFKGMGATIISQRPAELYKGILQLHLLIALGMTTPHDIRAVDEWISRNATQAERQTFLSTLSTLPIGEAWVWSPQWLHLFERVKIRLRQTFDSSKTPDVDSIPVEPKRLAEIDLSILNAQIVALTERARETDPVVLQQRIHELEEQLKTAGSSPARSASGTKADRMTPREFVQTREQLVQKDQEIQRLTLHLTELARVKTAVNGSPVSLIDVPAYLQQLHIDTATITIQRVDGESGSVQSLPRSKRERRQEESNALPVPSETVEVPATVGGLSREEQETLNRLLKKVNLMTPNERRLFTKLLSHDQEVWRAVDLARAVGITKRATVRDRTGHLDKIEFIVHDGEQFHAAFAQYATLAFRSAKDLQAIKQAFLDAVW